MRNIRLYLGLVWLVGVMLSVTGQGCSRMNNEMTRSEIEAKLNAVLQQMVDRCGDAGEREGLRTAELFQKIEGLPIDVVGLAVPISASNRVHISFTLDHLSQTPVSVLAAEGLEDYRAARAVNRRGPNG